MMLCLTTAKKQGLSPEKLSLEKLSSLKLFVCQ